jgi:hypothetical protein
LPIIEAMACGSLPEVAGVAAVFIDPRSETEICAALEQLINHPDAKPAANKLDLSEPISFHEGARRN